MKLFDLLKSLVGPVVRIALAVLFPLGYVIAALRNPSGALNHFAIKVIDALASVWPSTPEGMTLAGILLGPTQQMGFGRYVISEFFALCGSFMAVIVLVKLYKLIPFKAT